MSSSSCAPLRKRYRSEIKLPHEDLTKCHDDDLTQALQESKHHDDLTKNHEPPTDQGLQETEHSTKMVTVRAGSQVTFLDPQDTTKVIKTVTVKRDLRLEVAIIKKDHGKPNDTTTKDTTTTTTTKESSVSFTGPQPTSEEEEEEEVETNLIPRYRSMGVRLREEDLEEN